MATTTDTQISVPSTSDVQGLEKDSQPQSSSVNTVRPEEEDVSVNNSCSTDHRPEALPGYLPWEGDLEMTSKYLDRKEALEESHHEYLGSNPEVKAILADFLQALLIQKPDDVYRFARDFFTPFDPKAPHAPSYPSYKPSAET